MTREYVPSAFGTFVISWNDDALGVDAASRGHHGAVTHLDIVKRKLRARGNSVAFKAVNAWVDGDIDALLKVPVLQAGTAFKQEVWHHMRLIESGDVASYAQLAAKTSSPQAIRATASTCATNQIPLIVPCHRVIQSGGLVGNYAMGQDLKIALLEHEGVEIY
jgi:O-6-methylguanine DNA methyltransferase